MTSRPRPISPLASETTLPCSAATIFGEFQLMAATSSRNLNSTRCAWPGTCRPRCRTRPWPLHGGVQVGVGWPGAAGPAPGRWRGCRRARCGPPSPAVSRLDERMAVVDDPSLSVPLSRGQLALCWRLVVGVGSKACGWSRARTLRLTGTSHHALPERGAASSGSDSTWITVGRVFGALAFAIASSSSAIPSRGSGSPRRRSSRRSRPGRPGGCRRRAARCSSRVAVLRAETLRAE